ncbi:MAG: hypothetical protein R3331_03080 [Sulfurospirillaceae bacterium]|nr:hypothetical protein [Sulfurospirillaceae bacterium]
MRKHIIIFLSVLLFFSGCAIKQDAILSYPYKIVVKTQNIGIADAGFLKKSSRYKNLQIFSAGSLVLNLKLSNKACLNGRCTTREDFNTKLFGYPYYKNIMDDILNKNQIYNGKNIKYIKDGFEQRIKSKNYDILYKIEDGNIYFKDRQNKVLIKLERI